MITITDKDIHLFILNQSLLSDQVIKEIKKRISIDDEFRSSINEVKEFYEIYHKFEKYYLQNSFYLKPIFNNKANNYLKLAAQQDCKTDKLKFINTFATAEEFILARLFYNPLNKEYELYVLCEDDVSKASYAIIKLENIDREFIADKNGVAKIKADYINDMTNIKVTLPTARFIISPAVLDPIKTSARINSKTGEYETDLILKKNIEKIECQLEFILNVSIRNLKAFLIHSNDFNNPEIINIIDNKFNFSYKPPEEIIILIFEEF